MVLLYKIMLFMINLALLLFLVVQFVNSLRSKNKLMSWSMWFYMLCFLWTVFRLVFWILSIVSVSSWSALTFYLLYWFPSPIQFANFSLLVLFYIQVLSGREWRTRWIFITLPVYFFVTILTTAFTVVWAFMSYKQLINAESMVDQYYVKLANQSVQRIYSALSFGTLGFLFGYFGYKMSQLEGWQHRRMLITNPRTLGVVNALLCGLFVSRSIFDLGSGLDWWLVPQIRLTSANDVSLYDFLVNIFWEVLPTMLLLLMISTKSGGVGAPSRSSLLVGNSTTKLPDYGLFHVINRSNHSERLEEEDALFPDTASPTRPDRSRKADHARERSEQPRWTHGGDLFDDPLRYDSDDGGGGSLTTSYETSQGVVAQPHHNPPHPHPVPQRYPHVLHNSVTSNSSNESYEYRRNLFHHDYITNLKQLDENKRSVVH